MSKTTQATETRIRLVQFIQIAVSGVGLFAAFLYFLGRLRLEAYYSELGMSPLVMKFDTNDYMFSSFNIVMMLLMICLVLYAGYERIKQTSAHEFLGFQTGSIRGRLAISGLVLGPIAIFVIIILVCRYPKIPGLGMPGLLGFFLGLIFGILLLDCAGFMQWLIRPKTRKVHPLAIAIIGVLVLFLIPPLTNDVGHMEAKSDRLSFPEVKLISEGPLPSQLQSSAETPNQSIKVKMVTANNGMTYVLQQEKVSDDNWQVYAIPQEDINQIIYYPEKK